MNRFFDEILFRYCEMDKKQKDKQKDWESHKHK